MKSRERAVSLYIYNNRGRLVKLSWSSKNHATYCVSMRIPKGIWMRLCCRDGGIFTVVFSRDEVCAWKLYAHGIHKGHAACRPRPYLYVYTGPLVYIAAIVHGEQPLSTRARIPANIDPVVARDGSNGNWISLPPLRTEICAFSEIPFRLRITPEGEA